jgi:hypothetical protein
MEYRFVAMSFLRAQQRCIRRRPHAFGSGFAILASAVLALRQLRAFVFKLR